MILLSAIGLLTRGGAGVIAAGFVLAFGVIYARVVMEVIVVFFPDRRAHTGHGGCGSLALVEGFCRPSAGRPRFDPQTGQPLS